MTELQGSTLQEELKAVEKYGKEVLPKIAQAAIEQSIETLRESGSAQGLGVGDSAPDFTLANQAGNAVTLSEELAKGPVILTFYRGAWCPFCNLELRAYQRILGRIQVSGAQLLAISPQTPDRSLTAQEKNELGYHVLSDIGNRTAERYKLKFKLPDALHDIYRSLGFALDAYNGDDTWELPVPATYVIGRQGRTELASVDPDYRTRLEPSEVLNVLQSL
ncbi:peroxiredoxin-like family protein [Cohnella nanjingensis]|uniref:thioredoxin-dependent peroxiredoxin n=1 Tax=Cohnella nanjingensis TaxID=1387779 RepID=A0A7X0VFP3_9BACL|nr:peroxiredoxin-like family protein [Cohnella nanjingensis]MBB6672026.1 AhpC/TSA family protein [Cohnella nanjingensis]